MSLSGLPGVTSHQTRSSPSRLQRDQAGRAMRRMRRIEGAAEQADAHAARVREEGEAIGLRDERDDRFTAGSARVPRTRYLKRGELLDADRPARMEAAGGDADLGAEAELAAVGELGRGVVQHDRRIDLAQEFLGRRLVLGDDRVGVVRAVALDVRDGGVDAVDHLDGDDGVEIFGRPVLLAAPASRARSAARTASSPRTSQPASSSIVDQRLEMRRRDGAIDQQRLGGAADAGAPHLGVEHDRLRHVERRRPCRHRRGRCLRDARTPARAPPPARARPGSCRRAARSRRWCRRGRRASSRRRRGRGSAPAGSRLRGRPAAVSPATMAAWIARDWSAGSPSRRAGSRRCRP